MGESPTVFVVDDDPSLQAGLDSLLRSAGYRSSVFASGHDFLDALDPEAHGCALLDVRMREMDGLQVQTRLIESKIALPVIFLTGFGDVPMTVTAVKKGAVDFLLKPFREHELLAAVARAIDQDRTQRADARELKALRETYASLTKRERQVMNLVCRGLLNKQVADQLQISEVMVKVHRGHAMQKMGTKNLPHLVRLADRLAAAEGTHSD